MISKPAPPIRPRNGFTLVEVLVALVVTSMLLTIIMDGALTAHQRARTAVQQREAVQLARNLLTEAAVYPYSAGTRSGEESGLRWQVHETAAQEDPIKRFVLAAIEVKITNPRGVLLFTVGTRRLKAVPDA